MAGTSLSPPLRGESASAPRPVTNRSFKDDATGWAYTKEGAAMLRQAERTEAMITVLLDEVRKLKERVAIGDGSVEKRASSGSGTDKAEEAPRKAKTPSSAASSASFSSSSPSPPPPPPSSSEWVRVFSSVQSRYCRINLASNEVVWESTPRSNGWEEFALPDHGKVRHCC